MLRGDESGAVFGPLQVALLAFAGTLAGLLGLVTFDVHHLGLLVLCTAAIVSAGCVVVAVALRHEYR